MDENHFPIDQVEPKLPGTLTFHLAGTNDLDMLAEWNYQLIRDEGHRNPMTVGELRQRMENWLRGEYRSIIYEIEGVPVAYALYRENESEIYLRQFFVHRQWRRKGIGRRAFNLLKESIWPDNKRLTVEVLTANTPAVAFWRAMGYRDYSLMLEIPRNE